MNRVEAIVEAAVRWPGFVEHKTAILTQYLSTTPIFDNYVDLQIAYATVVGRHSHIDWRAECGIYSYLRWLASQRPGR